MNPFEQFINLLRDLATSVPELLQPLIIALAGAVPFVEGELAAVIGVWAGVNPVVVGVAAAAGNFLSVLGVVLVGSRTREAVLAHRSRTPVDDATQQPQSKGRQRFGRFLVRFGVPGASILGPLAMPTQFTSAILVGSGVSKGWVLLWQGVAIALWTTLATLLTVGADTLLLP